jgi:hypothetical protein
MGMLFLRQEKKDISGVKCMQGSRLGTDVTTGRSQVTYGLSNVVKCLVFSFFPKAMKICGVVLAAESIDISDHSSNTWLSDG